MMEPLHGQVKFGDLRRLTPISAVWGSDRGRPLDRYYIENFLYEHRGDITGRVLDGSGQSVGGAFVRLLDASDEFTAEVVASATGDFRFFAAPGTWTLRALSPAGNGDASVAPSGAGIHEVDVKVA